MGFGSIHRVSEIFGLGDLPFDNTGSSTDFAFLENWVQPPCKLCLHNDSNNISVIVVTLVPSVFEIVLLNLLVFFTSRYCPTPETGKEKMHSHPLIKFHIFIMLIYWICQTKSKYSELKGNTTLFISLSLFLNETFLRSKHQSLRANWREYQYC